MKPAEALLVSHKVNGEGSVGMNSFHPEQQFSWCANIWCAHNRVAYFIVFRKVRPKPSPVLYPWEMTWWVMPPSCFAGTIKSANFKFWSLQINSCNIPLSHAFCALVVTAAEQHRETAQSSKYLELFVPVPAVTPSITLDQVLSLCVRVSVHI